MPEDRFFYSNGSEIGVSPYDINLKFLRSGTSDPRGKPAVILSGAHPIDTVTEDYMLVSMSPGYAKAMVVALYQAITDYEKRYGLIAGLDEANKAFETTFGRN